MSASSNPTLAPSAASASARFTAVVLLPTPPLPDATATIFFTPGNSCTPRCTAWGTTFMLMLTETLVTPATVFAAAINALRKSPVWLLAGYPNSTSNATSPSEMTTLRTALDETKSRPVLGSITLLRAPNSVSCVNAIQYLLGTLSLARTESPFTQGLIGVYPRRRFSHATQMSQAPAIG